MLDENDINALKALVADSARVLVGDAINEEYSHDELASVRVMPDAVVKAVSASEVSAVLKFASSRLVPVTPRGAGTGLVGAAVPVKRGIVLDMSAMNRVIELDEDNLTVTVEPGILLMELAEFCDSHGLMYPPDPGEKTATVGGNISTNAGGMRAVKYGVTRDYVRALEVVTADGEILEIGGKTVKNSSGYDLKDLFIGSEGTLGVITKAVLRLIPKPLFTISLLVPFPTLKEAIDTVPVIMRSKWLPTAVEFMQREVIRCAESYLGSRFPDGSADAYLLLKFDGASEAETATQYDAVSRLCLSCGASDVFLLDTDERNDSVWKPRGAFLEAIKSGTSEMDEADVAVPRSAVAEMAAFVSTLQEKHGIRILFFGHAGDGNLHVYLLRDSLSDAEWKAAHSGAMRDMYEKASALGGIVSGEHGIGYVKREFLKQSLQPQQLEYMKRIKAVFDPNGILNPCKVCMI